MKYLHPDVHDNGLNHLRNNAIRAIVIPEYYESYADVVASAIVTTTISPADFTLSSVISADGGGRKLVFTGKSGPAVAAASPGSPLHVAFTDGSSRILWVEEIENSVGTIIDQHYLIKPQTVHFPQPIQSA